MTARLLQPGSHIHTRYHNTLSRLPPYRPTTTIAGLRRYQDGARLIVSQVRRQRACQSPNETRAGSFSWVRLAIDKELTQRQAGGWVVAFGVERTNGSSGVFVSLRRIAAIG